MSFNNLSPQEQQADLIHRYLFEELTDTEKLQFEIRINNDPSLSKEVKIYRSLLGNMKAIRREAMAEKLNDWYQEHAFSNVKKRHLWPVNVYYHLAAVAIILVLFFGYWIWTENNSTTSLPAEALYSEAFLVYPAEDIFRSPNDTSKQTKLKVGLNYYNKGMFKEAKEALSLAFKDSATSSHYRLFLGIAYLKINEPDNAILEFKILIDPLNDIYGKTAQWYLALAYLKKGDKVSAELVLKEITNHSRHSHKTEAEVLLKKF